MTPIPAAIFVEIPEESLPVGPQGIAGDRYVAIFAYCAGLNPWPTNDTVKVEQSCSDVSVMRVRP